MQRNITFLRISRIVLPLMAKFDRYIAVNISFALKKTNKYAVIDCVSIRLRFIKGLYRPFCQKFDPSCRNDYEMGVWSRGSSRMKQIDTAAVTRVLSTRYIGCC
jgi:hypothetical protein